jgi:hypothetical protein
MRTSVFPRVLIAAVTFTAGCTTLGVTYRKPAAVAKKSTQVADEPAKTADSPKADSSKSSVAKSESPFKSSRERTASTTTSEEKPAGVTKPDDVVEAMAEKPSPKPAPSETVAQNKPHFTREMLQLIDSELRDATPAERARWFEELKLVDSALIPEILRARRLSLQLTEANPQPQPVTSSPLSDQMTALEAVVTQRSTSPSFAKADPFSAEILTSRPKGPKVVDVRPETTTRTGIQQTAFTNPTTRGVQTAGYQFDPQRPQQPIVLQNMEYQPTANASVNPPFPPASQSPEPPSIDSRLLPQTSPAMPATIPWPPAKSTASVTNANASSSSTPFGAGFVQNVVGLMPNRGAAANAPTAPSPITPSSTATTSNAWTQELDRTTAYLEQEVVALKPGTTPESQAIYIRRHVALRMLYLMGDHQERALTAIPGLPPAEQEFWQQLFWGMSNALDAEHIPNAKDRATQAIAQLNSAVRRLQEQADLQIRNVAFCRQIQYFGNYERFPRDEFRPGQEVLLYAEIDNFKSEPTADGQYRTLLRSTLELLSPSGELRKIIDFPATEDLCRNYRRDYFHNYQFVIPERLPLGPHTLKLTVFDELSGKMSSYSVNFVVK